MQVEFEEKQGTITLTLLPDPGNEAILLHLFARQPGQMSEFYRYDGKPETNLKYRQSLQLCKHAVPDKKQDVDSLVERFMLSLSESDPDDSEDETLFHVSPESLEGHLRGVIERFNDSKREGD